MTTMYGGRTSPVVDEPPDLQCRRWSPRSPQPRPTPLAEAEPEHLNL